MPRSSSAGGKSEEEIIGEYAKNLEDNTPDAWDFEEVQEKYPNLLSESMNTVLTQEVIRYNGLISLMKSQIVDVQKALKGQVVMSEDLEQISRSLFLGQVPIAWSHPTGFLSLKPLSSWIDDLQKRISFLQKWIDEGKPNVFWFSGFFFPQAFITGCLQNYARKYTIAIDRLAFEYRVIDDITPEDVTEPPDDGVYVNGMFMEGGRWDSRKKAISQPLPKELFSSFPIIWLNPIPDRVPETEGFYECPLYKTVLRTGTLSTTGHSTNFVMYLEITSRDHPDVWILGGCAMFLALRY